MSYLIAVLPNRTKAEAASSALVKNGLSTTQISIIGEGYQSADGFGLVEPNQQVTQQIIRLAYWLIPVGFIAGYIFLTGIAIFPGVSSLINHIIAGIIGAIAGALAALVGGGVGIAIGGGDALTYRNRINAGKYLIAVKAPEDLIRQATRVLRQFEPEAIQGYQEPTSA
ncbi:hypothetical protein [Coleofasciculus sp. E2-BRE-01]|uniref:hypothetical protein n=1 Tax=Coleofasciculus sp. E2-BRE-01 TaxID=3069524 RepID=UPI0032F22096